MGGGGVKGELLLLTRNTMCDQGLHRYCCLWAASGASLWVCSHRDVELPMGLPRGWQEMLKTRPQGVAMRRQGWGLALGTLGTPDVPEHEVTRLLLAAGGDFSQAAPLPRSMLCAMAFPCQQPLGTTQAKMGAARGRRPSAQQELSHPHASVACMTTASFLRALVPSRRDPTPPPQDGLFWPYQTTSLPFLDGCEGMRTLPKMPPSNRSSKAELLGMLPARWHWQGSFLVANPCICRMSGWTEQAEHTRGVWGSEQLCLLHCCDPLVFGS